MSRLVRAVQHVKIGRGNDPHIAVSLFNVNPRALLLWRTGLMPGSGQTRRGRLACFLHPRIAAQVIASAETFQLIRKDTCIAANRRGLMDHVTRTSEGRRIAAALARRPIEISTRAQPLEE